MGAFGSSSFDDQQRTGADVETLSLRFGHNDIAVATNYFSSENKLGSGTAGEVYRGCLHGGTEVAVKVLSGGGGLGTFEDELQMLSRFRHPNLVTLLGWGTNDVKGTKFLVYEFLPGGDVGKCLYKSKRGRQTFLGQHRAGVALDVSCGLSFMVNSKPKAFHRDIKPSNILLDASGNAKLADFGLANFVEDEGEERSSVEEVGGTPGYVCPEYLRTGKVTEQSEVYSFGVTVLEFLLNELPARAAPNDQITYPINSAVRPAEGGAHGRIMERLDHSAAWPQPTADELATLALHCVKERPTERPCFASLVIDLRRVCQRPEYRTGCAVPANEPPPRRRVTIDSGTLQSSTGISEVSWSVQRSMSADFIPSFLRSSDTYVAPPAMVTNSATLRAPQQHPGDRAKLVCSHARGQRVTNLRPEDRSVTLSTEPVEIGRQHLPGFFEQLLADEPQWLRYISRSHCRVQIVPAAPGWALKIENLSANVIFVSRHPQSKGSSELHGLSKGESEIISLGGTLEFAAKPWATGEQIQFLRFIFIYPA